MSPQPDVDLQPFNTLATPCRAQWYARLSAADDFDAVWQFARDSRQSLWVLGGGSNVVLGEQLPGVALHQCSQGRKVLAQNEHSVTVAVAGGENWHEFVHWTITQGWAGLENLALIPGSVGAAPIQNIGAYGAEVGGFVERVVVRHLHSAERLQLTRDDCQFGYRDSAFKHELRDQVLIEQVIFNLPLQAELNLDYPALAAYLAESGLASPSRMDVFEAVVAIRSSKLPDPAQVPNVGSFFKNPQLAAEQLQPLLERYPQLPHYPRGSASSVPAAWLIEQCGFKRLQPAPVRVHAGHALVIINPEQRAADEIRAFAGQIQAAVNQRFGIMLEQEPRDYG